MTSIDAKTDQPGALERLTSMQDYRLITGASGVVTGLIWATVNFIQRDIVFGTILLALTGLLLGAVLWLARGNGDGAHTSHAEAQAAAGEADVIVYWQPGCIYCDRLKMGLGSARQDVSWVNILKDPEAAVFVAGYHGGNQAVPTVVTGAGEMISPTPAAIKTQLEEGAVSTDR